MKSKITILIVSLLALGCAKDDGVTNPVKTVVAFEGTALAFDEADEALVVTVTFDQPAHADGNVEVSFGGTATNPEHYIVLPELEEGVLVLEFEEGDEEAQFMLLPINDQVNTGDKSVELTLSNPSAGFVLGTKTQSQVNLTDDDEDENPNETERAAVNFTVVNASIIEDNTGGMEINLTLSQASEFHESVEIAVGIPANLEYSVHFYTVPETVDGIIPVSFDPGQMSKSFAFYPIDNNALNNDVEFVFTISNWTPGLEPGAQYDSHLSLIDDEEEAEAQVYSIQALRDYFESHEGDWGFTSDYFIEGVVTSTDNVVSKKSIYIQDETVGIMLVFVAPNILTRGTKVRLNLKNATGEIVNGQKTMMGVEDRLGTTLATDVYVHPREISLDDLIDGTYSGQLVKIKEVYFSQADGERKWDGSNYITDGINPRQGIVSTYSHVSFSQDVLPEGVFSITGIAGSWNRLHVISNYSVQYF